jgi:hypothetical protein
MKVDFTAMWQGVSDALDAGSISQALYDELWNEVRIITFLGISGRDVCDYGELMSVLSSIQPDSYFPLARLWRNLGPSLASGLSVASQE